MIKSRVEHRCLEMEHSLSVGENGNSVTIESVKRQSILLQEVAPPYSLEKVSLATKQCFVRSFKDHLPIYFQSGAIIPYERVREGNYTAASFAFLPIEKNSDIRGIMELPAGQCICTYHTGDYVSIGKAYERILDYCAKNHLQIISDSYEFAINDYLSTGNEDEYITKIIMYFKPCHEC